MLDGVHDGVKIFNNRDAFSGQVLRMIRVESYVKLGWIFDCGPKMQMSTTRGPNVDPGLSV